MRADREGEPGGNREDLRRKHIWESAEIPHTRQASKGGGLCDREPLSVDNTHTNLFSQPPIGAVCTYIGATYRRRGRRKNMGDKCSVGSENRCHMTDELTTAALFTVHRLTSASLLHTPVRYKRATNNKQPTQRKNDLCLSSYVVSWSLHYYYFGLVSHYCRCWKASV